VIKRLYAAPMECYKRGDFVVEAELNNRGGLREKAIAASANDTASESQYVVSQLPGTSWFGYVTDFGPAP
jgi:hypothetical protein